MDNQLEQVLHKVTRLKSFYYFKFMGGLALYVEYIRKNYDYINELYAYAQSVTPKKVILPGPTILGKMDKIPDSKGRI